MLKPAAIEDLVKSAQQNLTRQLVQNVYANMSGNVMVHVAVPALGMVATHWAVVSWSKIQVQRESVYDLKYIYRCAQ